MNKQPSRIGLYLVLIIALVAGYFYLNNQVVSQSSYTQKQLEQALEDNKVVDATIQQNREVPTGAVIVDTTDDVTDVIISNIVGFYSNTWIDRLCQQPYRMY